MTPVRAPVQRCWDRDRSRPSRPACPPFAGADRARPPVRQERARGGLPGRARRGPVHRRAAGRRGRRDRPALPVPGRRRHLRDRAPRAGLGRAGGRDPAGRRRTGRDRAPPPPRAGAAHLPGGRLPLPRLPGPARPAGRRPRRIFRKPKSLPSQFSAVVAPEAEDFAFLAERMGDLPVGQLRSGETVVDFTVGIPGRPGHPHRDLRHDRDGQVQPACRSSPPG